MQLIFRYSQKEKDFVTHYPSDVTDGNLLLNKFDEKFIKELQNRGYDTTTIHFSIKKLK